MALGQGPCLAHETECALFDYVLGDDLNSIVFGFVEPL
jgi:hypothetical protein